MGCWIMKLQKFVPCIFVMLLLTLSPPGFSQEVDTGSVTGVVYDASTGQPVPQVTVFVIEKPGYTAITTTDGTFKIELPPGTYSLRMTGDKYQTAEMTDVVVTAGEIADASTVMAAKSAVTSIDVVESVNVRTATEESAIVERKLSSTVSDSISAEEIKASTASDAAGALQKVTGVTVVGKGFVYVRGLGERYSSTQLNNAMLASTEPEKRVVPLDLFPAGLIDNIQVLKTYTPDLPGEFSAGLVKIRTTDFPSHPVFQVNYGIGFNSQTTGKLFNSYPGGSHDFWGFDDGSRNMPADIPRDTRVDRFNFSPSEIQAIGRSLPDSWELTPKSSARPSENFGLVAGNTWGKLGVVGAVQFSNDLSTIPNQDRIFYVPNPTNPETGTPLPKNIFKYDESTVNVRLGAILNASYQATPTTKFFVRNFLSRDTDNNGRIYTGYHDDFGTDVLDQRLRWIERQIYSGQVGGEHLVRGLHNSILNWQLGYSRATRDEPDLREDLYLLNDRTGKFEYFDDSQSAFRMWNYQTENVWNPQINWLLPFYKGGLTGSIKLGVDYNTRQRDFSSRRLRFRLAGAQNVDPSLPPNELLAYDNIRPGAFELNETTRVTDAYNARRDVYGGYAMLDISLTPRLRAIGGLRIESVDQDVTTFNPFAPDQSRVSSPFVKKNYLPAANVVYYLTPKQNLRFGYSQTVSRPDFRELALFDFLDIVGGRQTVGNPDLRQTSIHNVDGRWEWFPGGGQLVAASVFYKSFKDPIERTIRATVGLLTTFDNAETADNYGVELEFRRNLGWLNPRLSPFAVSTNFTLVKSQIDLSNVTDTPLTTKVRPMQGQSKYVYNFIGEWARPKWRSTARFYVNWFSSRITDVGSYNLPDVIQHGVVTTDLVYEFNVVESGKFKIRVSAENLNDPSWLWTQGGETFQRWSLGRSLKIGTSYQIF